MNKIFTFWLVDSIIATSNNKHYVLARLELEECDELCHGNWIEIESLQRQVDFLNVCDTYEKEKGRITEEVVLSLFLDIIRKHKKIINKMKYIDVRKNVRYNIDDIKNLVIQFIRERQ